MNQAQVSELFKALNLTFKTYKNYWLAQCPQHKERTGKEDSSPSCRISTTYPHQYKCWSCGASGTLNQLAQSVGYEVSNQIAFSSEKSTFKLPNLSTLRLEPWTGSYRGITEETWKYFGALRWYDTFVAEDGTETLSAIRLLLPIWQDGLLVSYVGRRIDDNTLMRYNNYKFAPAAQILYLYDFLQPTHPVVLTEGPLDAIRYLVNGIPAVAILGAMNWQAYKTKLLLKKAPSTVWLSMDGDNPGQVAQKELYQKLKRYFDVQLISLPSGVDPFELIPESLEEIKTAVWTRHLEKLGQVSKKEVANV